MEKTFKLAVGVCCCLQTRSSVANLVVVMGLVLEPSLMVVSTTVFCYMQKYLPFTRRLTL